MRALTAIHLTSDNLLCVLNGYSSLGACDPDYESDKRKKKRDERDRKHGGNEGVEPCVLRVRVGSNNKSCKIINEGRNRGDDIRKEYKRDTVSDSLFVDSLRKPHDEASACGVAGDDNDGVEPCHLATRCGMGEVSVYTIGCIAVLEKEVITYRGDDSENYRHDSGDEVHLLLIRLCKLAELREHYGKKLNDN